MSVVEFAGVGSDTKGAALFSFFSCPVLSELFSRTPAIDEQVLIVGPPDQQPLAFAQLYSSA